MKKIIYKNTDNSISVLTATPDTLSKMTIEQIAKKDVPSGVKYKIIDESELPADRTYRDFWQYDFENDFDGVGGA